MASLPKILDAILGARSDANLRFSDLTRVLRALGFIERVRGGHHIFSRDGIDEIINIQPLSGGKAKAYQVKQVRQIIAKYQMFLR